MQTTQRAIDARNSLNLKADQVESALLHLMPEFLNKKVWKISGYGGKSAAFAKAVDAFSEANGIGQCNNGTAGSFWLYIRSDVSNIYAELVHRYEEPSGNGYAISHQIREDFRIGKRNDEGILVELEKEFTYPSGRTQFDFATVKAMDAQASELESQARGLRRQISVFNRH